MNINAIETRSDLLESSLKLIWKITNPALHINVVTAQPLTMLNKAKLLPASNQRHNLTSVTRHGAAQKLLLSISVSVQNAAETMSSNSGLFCEAYGVFGNRSPWPIQNICPMDCIMWGMNQRVIKEGIVRWLVAHFTVDPFLDFAYSAKNTNLFLASHESPIRECHSRPSHPARVVQHWSTVIAHLEASLWPHQERQQGKHLFISLLNDACP